MTPKEHKELMKMIIGQEWHLDRLYSLLSKELAPILKKYKQYSGKSVWKGNEKARAELKDVLKRHNIRLTKHIENQIVRGWELSNKHSDELVSSYTKGMAIPSDLSASMTYRNTTLIDNYIKYGRDKKLSERVWNTTKQSQEQIDLFLKEGLANGRSAAELAGDLKKYLKDPNRRFRRIRDENGKLILSNPARNYRPGQGIYRSSYKNALRLARNEINIGYRIADVDRRKRMPFVVGVTVCLSHSHPKMDICDELVGDYPSNYVFTGFHPSCFCYTKSKLLPKAEFKKYLKTGKIPNKYKVKGIDAKRLKYVNSNKDKLKDLYFFKDNKGLWENDKKQNTNEISFKLKPNRKKKQAYKSKTLISKKVNSVKDVQGIIDKYVDAYPDELGDKKINIDIFRKNATIKGFTMMSANHKSRTIRFNTSSMRGSVSPFVNLKNALNKIKNSEVLTFEEEYGIESLYHEILHLKAQKHKVLLPHGMGDFKRTAMETINQFVSRHEYRDFIKALGGNAVYSEKVLSDGFGYSRWVSRFRFVIDKSNLSEIEAYKYFREKLIYGSYDELDYVLYEFLSSQTELKLNKKEMLKVFESGKNEDFTRIFNSNNR